ncbi:MAG: hypothetical protein AB4372_21935 [Xenococcus sp. (in: cyanobacteria)]
MTSVMTPEKTSLPQGLAAVEEQSVNEQEVRELFKAGEVVSIEALAGNGFTYRQNWGNKNGQWILHLNWSRITNNSRVFVAIGEGKPGGGKFIGGARYTLHNVAPQNGRVSIWVNIEWNSPIRLSVDYLIVNP